MKKLLLFLFLLAPLSAFASDRCASDRFPSNTNYYIIEKIAQQKNKNEEKNISSILKLKKFNFESIDFWNLPFSRYQNSIEFWRWIAWGWMDGWPCYYPQRTYSMTREKWVGYDETLAVLVDNTTNNIYADENSPSLPFWTLIGWTNIYETGSIGGVPYIITKGLWEIDGSTNYSLWLIGKKYNYLFQWPHNNSYEDVLVWKKIIQSIRFK